MPKILFFLAALMLLGYAAPVAASGEDTAAGPRCLGTFTGPVTVMDQRGYMTTKVPTWAPQARFDARGGMWESLMNGNFHENHANRRRTAPLQFGLDWGDNIDGSRRRDLWASRFNTAPQKNAMCFFGGVVVGTQPLNATWRETKVGGGGYAISVNGLGAVVEGMRVHNHHDGFVPYRSNGFIYRHNWQSYTRDDCVENDGGASGLIARNLFDGCFVFYSNSWGGVRAGGSTVTIANNLIRMEPMPGPPPDVPRIVKRYGTVLKVKPGGPKMIWRNNVLALESRGAGNAIKSLKDRIDECSGNIILWLGGGAFPYTADVKGTRIEKCFTIVTGSDARNQWHSRKAAWIEEHPEIARLSTD